MLTKEQKHFRKEMKKIKKEKGELYHEIYEESAPSRFKEGTTINYGTLIRIGLFLAFFAWPMYQSVRRAPMLSKEGGLVSYSAQRPLDVIEATSPLVGKREELCNQYLQEIALITERLNTVSSHYSQENITLFTVKEEVNNLQDSLEQIKVISHGEALKAVVLERLALVLDYFSLVEDLRKTNLLTSEEEKLIWEEKKRIASELEGQLEEIAYRHKEESKLLLEKYGMSYTESEGRIEYRYRSHDLMPSL